MPPSARLYLHKPIHVGGRVTEYLASSDGWAFHHTERGLVAIKGAELVEFGAWGALVKQVEPESAKYGYTEPPLSTGRPNPFPWIPMQEVSRGSVSEMARAEEPIPVEPEVFACPQCSAEAKTLAGLKAHIRHKHPEPEGTPDAA